MPNDKFKPGEIVQLKAGGPKMVVERVANSRHADSSTYYCTWFSGAKHNHEGFKEESIQPFLEDDK
ncbi:MAG: DUF2158 domain-containing protein [Sneathiella sp.]|nr:MAG: DUF2158 domain-containing protein [Sneathiella sp.]